MANAPTSVRKAASEIVQDTNEAGGIAGPWPERLARFGYAVRGVLYLVVGFLALQLALGHGGAVTDKNGAIATIGSQPFGKVLLVLVLVGLAGYSAWGFVRAIFDPLDRGSDPKGIAQRIGYAVSGLTYGALIIPTLKFLMGAGDANKGGNGSQDLTATLLSQPFGPWLVGLLGLIGMGGGLGQIWQGVTADFKKDLKFREMSPDTQGKAIMVGRAGMVARGITFAMLGFFILQAALHHDPKQAKGLDGALQTLAAQPYGPWLLAAVALGLAAFGVYSLLCAKWIQLSRK